MSKENLDNPQAKREPMKPGDSTERIAALIQAAIDSGSQEDDILQITIPVTAGMRLWGTSMPVHPEDGVDRVVPANALFSEILSAACGKDINVYGVVGVPNTETGSYEHSILASVSGSGVTT